MSEKDIVLDVLSGVKSSLTGYATMITETANPELRQTFQQMRDGDEKFQYDLYKIASQKGYYVNSPAANEDAVNQLRATLSGGMTAC
ncbi:MAG: spore coat protein [Defluviitaleaceae bacterium]|nr:spore coat protein [Defluviitaleaceae bacterium]MCL2276006.1 spore coat protein [Defluviitaleaceae bacterium]